MVMLEIGRLVLRFGRIASPHQPSDTAKRCRWIRTVQHSNGVPTLQREEPSNLPTSEEAAESARLMAIKRQFVNRIDREAVRPVVGRTGAVPHAC